MFNQRILPNQARTDLVTFSLKVNGTPLGVSIPVMGITVHREINKIPWAKITIRDGDVAQRDFRMSNEDYFVPGNEMEILAGYHLDRSRIFKGIIVRHSIKVREGRAAVLEVECRDIAVKMTVTRKNKYFYNATDQTVIEEILGENDINDKEVDPMTFQHKELVQYDATDWDFILTRADANGKLVLAEDGTFKVKAPGLTPPSISLQYGATIHEFEADIDARYQYNTVKATAWNFAGQELVEKEPATGPAPPEQGNLSSTELAGVLGLDALNLRHSGEVVDQELENWAGAQLLRSQLGKIQGRVKIQGTAEIQPGGMIGLQGLGARFNGPAFVSSVHHFIADGRWLTDVKIGLSPNFFSRDTGIKSPPAAGLLPGIGGLQIGKVTQLYDDPDGEDRILVRVPVIDNNADGIWARVASLDAGSGQEEGQGRGAFFRPEVDDEVILGFINEDPRDAVILGMLNSSAKPAPLQAGDDNNHEKGFVTRSQMKMIWNDDDVSLTIETPQGNKVVLNEAESAIKMEDQNGNKVTLDSAGITLESAADLILKASGDLKFEGTNIEGKANVQFKAEGSAGLEVSSTGQTVVKGSIVKIN